MEVLNLLKLEEQIITQQQETEPETTFFYIERLGQSRLNQVKCCTRLGMVTEGLALANETMKMYKDTNVEMNEEDTKSMQAEM